MSEATSVRGETADLLITTGDWSTDCANGRAHGELVVRRMVAERNPLLISTIVREAIERGVWTGFEVGLFARLGCVIVSS